jgi:hypothetical protein
MKMICLTRSYAGEDRSLDRFVSLGGGKVWGMGQVEISASLDQWGLGLAQRAVCRYGMRIAASKLRVCRRKPLVVQVNGARR